jgi:hypothetical protein
VSSSRSRPGASGRASSGCFDRLRDSRRCHSPIPSRPSSAPSRPTRSTPAAASAGSCRRLMVSSSATTSRRAIVAHGRRPRCCCPRARSWDERGRAYDDVLVSRGRT